MRLQRLYPGHGTAQQMQISNERGLQDRHGWGMAKLQGLCGAEGKCRIPSPSHPAREEEDGTARGGRVLTDIEIF